MATKVFCDKCGEEKPVRRVILEIQPPEYGQTWDRVTVEFCDGCLQAFIQSLAVMLNKSIPYRKGAKK